MLSAAKHLHLNCSVSAASERRQPSSFATIGAASNVACRHDRHVPAQGMVMIITELTCQESLDLLARAHLGRIACARENQPYVVPFFFAFGDHFLYSFATVGQRIEWMRANPLVCVEADEIVTPEHWMTVIVFGRYQELPDTPESQQARVIAYSRLHTRANWWEPGYVETVLQGVERPLEPVYYRIQINEVTGRRAASSEPPSAVRQAQAAS
jgi:hypothetical protein